MGFTTTNQCIIPLKKDAVKLLKLEGFTLVDKTQGFWMNKTQGAVLTHLVATKRWLIKYTKPVNDNNKVQIC